MAGPAIAAVLYILLCMTIDAPRHPHRCNTSHTIHCLHGPVTFLTRESGLDVPLVRKVNIVGYIVNFYPRNRFAIFPVSDQLQNLRTFADAGYRLVTANAFVNTGYAGDRRLVCIDVAVLARNFIIRGVHRVTEFYGLDRTAVGEIFAMYPCADKQSYHEHKPKQDWFLCGLKRIENRDRQIVSPLLGQEFARKLGKLQIEFRHCPIKFPCAARIPSQYFPELAPRR